MMMTREERDALIDVTADEAARIAERFYEEPLLLRGASAAAAKLIGGLIADEIRKLKRQKP
jgi:cysteine synthase